MKNYNIGTKLLEDKKYKKAIPYLIAASDNPFKYLNLGNCYRELERYKEAEECYAKGLSLKIAKQMVSIAQQDPNLIPIYLFDIAKEIINNDYTKLTWKLSETDE